ncbi:MAG: hypothetical protein COA73_04930 [Candidatus Hydrogenedentota bacterium]|nr:MAG: hypothetical protein COA73_04930 [Candidatus Hydrogenedentota bacterium]
MTDVLTFLAVLGVLVFVHELGHFVAAKLCGVYVDRFSLGMPPRIFGIKIGDTDYCIGLLPIGGYVKMAGQEDAPLSDEEREDTYGHVPPEKWYNNKSKLQRTFILLAGPLMNLLLAFVIYLGFGTFGRETSALKLETRIGEVQTESPAESAPMYIKNEDGQADFSGDPDAIGWATGDRIVSINQKPMTQFQDILVEALLNEDDEVVVEIERPGVDGESTRYLSLVTSTKLDPEELAARFGYAPFRAGLIQHILPESPAEANGLQQGDIIVRADGEITDINSFSKMVQSLPDNSTLDLEVKRGDELIHLSLVTRQDGRFRNIAFSPQLDPHLMIQDNIPQKIATAIPGTNIDSAIQSGERVTALNGDTNIGSILRQALKTDPQQLFDVSVESPKPFLGLFGEATLRTVSISAEQLIIGLTGQDGSELPVVAGITSDMEKDSGIQRKDIIIEIDGQPATVALLEEIQETRIGETIPIKIKRPSMLFGIAQKEEVLESTLTVAPIQQIGVVWGEETIFFKEEPANIIPYAYTECVKRSREIFLVLSNLVTGQLSPKLLGGPVLIYQITTATARMGIYELLDTIAMISVNLFIFNLLPLPVLDGGQLTIIAVEAIRRKPISVRVTEMIQQGGVLFIIGLLLFVTFNDVSRVIENWLP